MGAGSLLGMPVDAVALGAVASAAVTMASEPKSRWLAVAYTVIGGLLGGALAPVLTHILVGEMATNHPTLLEQKIQLAHVFTPVVVGLGWQGVLKILRVLWPSFERHADKIVERLLNMRITWRDRK